MNALDQPYGDAGAKRELAELALRMHRCGVSRWRPNPVAACEAAEAEHDEAEANCEYHRTFPWKRANPPEQTATAAEPPGDLE